MKGFNLMSIRDLNYIKFSQFKESTSNYLRQIGLSSLLFDDKYIIVPGLCDVHVHFREPGFFYKETICTGSNAAAKGGYTTVCTMPNLNPVPDSKSNLQVQLDIIEKNAVINVLPYGSITKGEKGVELSDMVEISKYVCGFSDDGIGLANDELMLAAMYEAKKLGKLIVAHCEDKKYGTSSASEYKQLERDLKFVKMTGCGYHVCHISCKESVELIREAKKNGLNVSCETAPHYLLLNDQDVKDDGRYKMNPPIRSKEDQNALIKGIMDGTIDMIATDHAPHSQEEKSRGFANSVMGIVGLECAFSLMYTNFVKNGIITLDKLVELMSINPAKRFEIDMENSFAVFDVENLYKIDSNEFVSLGKSTPFDRVEVFGKCVLTVCDNKIVYKL